jgi:isopentenyl diphosphate isomerase/L-lactate dehydrogenase-like FMN-dependent dehydrogenase
MNPVNLLEFEALARECVNPHVFDFIAGGSDDEVTLGSNRTAYERIAFRPRVLVDVSTVDTSTEILGRRIAFPVLLAPTALQAMVHADGELATARAAAEAGTVMVVSTLASCTIEEIAAAADGPKWFQLYCYKEKPVTEELVQRAEAAGYEAICLTVDVPRLGRREQDLRNSFVLHGGVLPKNFEGNTDLAGVSAAEHGSIVAAYVAGLLDDGLTWDDVAWLKSITTLPLWLKGILTAEDAALAAQAGVQGIVVSNHGGRQLDGSPATIDVLPEIREAVGEAFPLLVDGGIRRGTDVVKALALGAQGALIGRPYLWGLGVGGQSGVAQILEMLRTEVELAMALCGCPSVADVTSRHVHLTRSA